jgi:hypothetical protein
MGTAPSPAFATAASPARRPSPPIARSLGRAVGAAIALSLLWAAWQGYRNPDFLLGLAAFRLC